MNNRSENKGGLTMFAAAMLGLILVAGLFAGPAATQAAPTYKVEPPHVVSIPANGKVTLKARGFCIDFGKPFPTGAMAPNGLAAANIRGALTYAIDKGYADGNAQQVQLAIWNLRDNIWHNDSHAVASEIVSNTTTTTPPTADALMLTDAMTQKSVDVSAQFVPQTADAFYGDGNVVITNTTAALNVYMPIGVVFTVPNGAGAFQDLVSYELVQAEGTPTAGATSVATGTAAASVTPAASATVEATGTALATVTSLATVESTATTAVATAEPTMTEAPTVEVATATAVPVSAPLPSTGGGSDSGLLVAFIVALSLSMAGLGLVMRLKKA